MIKSLGNSTTIAIATFIFLSFPGSDLRAERKIHQSSIEIARDLSRNVYEIDILADQMAFKYRWELGFSKGCKDSVILYRHLQKHSASTKDLVRAFRGRSRENFQKQAAQVQDSMVQIENLQKRTRVSQGVSRLIAEAKSKTAFILANLNSFQPEQAYPRLTDVTVNQSIEKTRRG